MSATSRPNVLIVMSDQHHPRFMGCAGHPFLETPHMDRIAGRGARFSNAYCNSPLCGPSRMAFLTGQLPSQINHLTNHGYCITNQPTFGHAFGEAGYETILCGRMHIHQPLSLFGYHTELGGQLVDYINSEGGSQLQAVLGSELAGTTGPNARSIRKSGPGTSGYLAYDEKIADTAAAWLRQRGEQPDERPFMMTVGFVNPHAPFVAYADDYKRYDRLIRAEDLPKPDPESLHPEMRRLQRRSKLEDAEPVPIEDQRRARVAYHGMCTFTDRMLGRVLDALDEAGLTENTIVAYVSDHGEQLGEHGMWWKHTFYEGSVGIPLVIAGPGVPRGAVIEGNVGLIDLPATLLDLCGGPEVPGAEGRSFRCLMEGREKDWHDTVISENLWPPDSDCIHRMIRKGPWKLNHYPGFVSELYNLVEDPGEEHDRINDPTCQGIREELEAEVVRNWDHAEVLRRHRSRTAAMSMLRRGMAPHFDTTTTWFDPNNPPENRIDERA